MVIILSLGAAFFYAVGNILIQIGLRYSGVLAAVFINLVWGFLGGLSVYLFTASIEELFSIPVLYFILAGVMGSFIARLLSYMGIERIGTSICSALMQSKPLFSALAAVVILDERLTISMAFGIVLMVMGTATISFEESGGKMQGNWSKKDLIFPLMAGACFGVSHVFRKMGLMNIASQPILGVTVQNAAALALFFPFTLVLREGTKSKLDHKTGWIIFSLSGAANLMAQACLFYALNLGQVVTVSPLVSLEPFFVLFLVGIFLRKVERITFRLVIGTILIVGGAVLLCWLPLNHG